MEVKKVATFQERFSELINSSSKSRTAIASEFGVAKQTISAWTTGQTSPRLPVVSSLADYFGVSSDWLLGFDVSKYPASEDPPDDPVEQPANDDVRLLIRGLNKLSPDQLEQAKNMMKIMFTKYADYFDKENDHET